MVEPILQLVPSPTKDLLAIVTAHTVHICVVPDSSHLAGPDIGPISPKTQILGPTIHVLEQAPITNVLWHPLGVDGNALVTVTSDAVVRIWELDMDNRSSLEEPTVALDLRKLRDARSAEDKLHPSRLGTSKGFSLSAVGMEVASACFGGSGSMDEGGWPGMTLWIAMTGGDVYALCPLLPSKWQPPSTAIPSLTTSIATKFAGSTEMNASAKEREIYAAQGQWITEIEKEKPIVVPGRTSLSPSISIYSRPKGTSFIPRLQGPFRIVPGDVDNDLNLADIYVVAPKLDAIDALDDDEGEFLEGTLDGLSTSLICLLTNEGRVYLCLDLDGVEGQWLASKKSNLKNHFAEEDEPEIVILEALDTAQTNSGRTNLGRPTFSRDVCSRYAFFVCHAQGVYYLSVDEWVELLENEFENPSASGAGLRLSNLTTSSHVLREQIFTFKHDPSKSEDIQPSAPIVLLDSDLGYFVLSLYQNSACAAIMDAPPEDLTEDSDDSITTQESTDLVLAAPPRVPYQPSERFSQPVALAAALESHINRRHKLSMKDEVRLSTATLDVMNEAHRFLSRETFTLGSAIGDLFSRCEEMQQEFRFQIGRVREIAGKVDKINEEDADDYEIEGPRGASKLEERLKGIEERHRELSMRHEALRKRVAQAGGRPLSEKEQAWTREVDKMAWTLITPDDEAEGTEGVRQKQYWSRLQEVSSCCLTIYAPTLTSA